MLWHENNPEKKGQVNMPLATAEQNEGSGVATIISSGAVNITEPLLVNLKHPVQAR